MAKNSTTQNFDRPVGVPPSDEELEKIIPNMQEESRAVRNSSETKWLVSSAVLEGFHYLTESWENPRVYTNPYEPKGTVRVKIPETLTRYRREKGRFLSILKTPTSTPISSGDPDIWRRNRFASGALSYLFHSTDFPDIFDSWVSDILVEGTAGIMPYWDETMTTSDGETGSVAFRPIPSWELFPFPASAGDDQATRGLTWSRIVGEEWIKQNLPAAIKEPQVDISSPYNLGRANSNVSNLRGYEIRWTFWKPSTRFPDGEMTVMVGDKIYIRKGELPFWLGRKRVVPISVARYTSKNMSWWGESFVYPIAQLNRETNRMMSLLVRRAILKAHPGYLMAPLGIVNTEDFKSQIGGLIQYKSNPIAPDSKPYWLQYPPSGADSDLIVNRFSQFSEDVSSQHGPTAGTSVGRVESSAAIQSLIRQDMIPMEGAIRSLDSAMKRAFGIAIEIGRSRWTSKRKASVAGPLGYPNYTVSFDPMDLPDMSDIRVLTGLDLPVDRPGMVQILTSLASTPTPDGKPLISPEEYRKGLVAMGITLPGIELISQDEEQAWQENYQMYGDGKVPGKIREPNPALEDLATHIRVHKKFSGSPEVQSSSEAVRLTFTQHIQMTMMAVQGSPVPPGFEGDADKDLGQEYDEEIESELAGEFPAGV